ncbi:hypothetical protein HK096_006996 [Nowakowskiella sp. JEL0078]|nr:hypothetical protein HK096_006996 [Nowakowskiella sp. JEL0078]
MMKRVVGTLAALFLTVSSVIAIDQWGPSFSFGPTTSSIVKVTTTLIPGHLPPILSTTGPLFIWPG